jgi:membrane associated rhomboid family serine protease
MSQAQIHPLEMILRMCAHAAPEPWFHQQFIRESGADPDQVDSLLELLWLEGLIQKVPGSLQAGPLEREGMRPQPAAMGIQKVPGSLQSGPGTVLTPLGQQVVADPALMARLVNGEPIRTSDVGAVIRNRLRSRTQPTATKLLIAANVLVFLWGAFLASQTPGLLGTYLSGFSGTEKYMQLLHELGSVRGADVQRGAWPRLMSATFLHLGLLHLAMNMYALYALGSFVEQVWGRWRLLVIYLISAWGGSCLAMAYSPGVVVVGASGAICGLLGAIVVGVMLYARHLPRTMAGRLRSQVFMNVALIIFISLIPGVSGWGHLGGALAGAAAALALHLQRFGLPGTVGTLPALRWGLALPLLIAVPVASYLQMQSVMKAPKTDDAIAAYVEKVSATTEEVVKDYRQQFDPLLEQHPTRRDPETVKQVKAAFKEHEKEVRRLGDGPGRVGERGKKATPAALPLLEALVDLCEDVQIYLDNAEKADRQDEKVLNKLFNKVRALQAKWKEEKGELLKKEEKP